MSTLLWVAVAALSIGALIGFVYGFFRYLIPGLVQCVVILFQAAAKGIRDGERDYKRFRKQYFPE